MKICSVDACKDQAKSKGWCSTHYGRWYRHGDPLQKCRTNKPVYGEFCSEELCDLKVLARGMCDKHYRSWYQRYDPDRVFTAGTRETFLAGLTENSTLTSGNVRIRCLHFGLLEPKCVGCGLEEWTCEFGTGTPLQLDHINGVNNDNRIENLRIVCANCHMLTDSFGCTKKALARKRALSAD